MYTHAEGRKKYYCRQIYFIYLRNPIYFNQAHTLILGKSLLFHVVPSTFANPCRLFKKDQLLYFNNLTAFLVINNL